MKIIYKIFLPIIFFLGIANTVFSQKDTVKNTSFEQELRVIRLLTETQQYSEAMRKLKEMEGDETIISSLAHEVDYRLLVSRVLRLSYQFDDAMHQLYLIPDLKNDKELKVKVDFRRAALFMENPKYSREERLEIVFPIINEGIRLSKEINNPGSLPSFYNLKASMLYDACAYIELDCEENKAKASEYYKKAMALFLINEDTLNYHNSLNGLFRLAVSDLKPEMDSLKELVLEFASSSRYFPNITVSRNLLGHYFAKVKQDSLGYFRQTLIEKNAMIDAVNKNADNTVGKLKLLYEFDSLKADINLNKNVIAQKDLMIIEKNRRITQNIIFSIVLGSLAIVLIVLLLRQSKLAREMRITNLALEKSNNNYQLLIKESHHRIKNNLQMILSIIELDKEGTSEANEMVLNSISSKVLTISALHKILDFREHNEKVNLRKYFDEIIEYFENFSKNEITFDTDFSSPKVESERIVYLGLILNEMISNTLQHRIGKDDIIIRVLKSDNLNIFIYRDNSDFKDYTKHSGITLIEDLIVRFGGVNMSFDPKYGEYKFYFDE